MAKKAAPKSASPVSKTIAAEPVSPAIDAEPAPVAVTDVRKTVAPKAAVAKKASAPLAHARIAERAYYLSQSDAGGSQDDNWFRAETELRNEN